jgi:hypothetical protein
MKINKEVEMRSIDKTIENRIVNCILVYVSDYYQMDMEYYKSNNRKREIVMLKHTASYFIKKYIKDITFAKIGTHFNNLDHATVLYGIRKITELMEFNKFVKNDIQNIDLKIKPYIDTVVKNSREIEKTLDFDTVTLLKITDSKSVLLNGFSELEENAYMDFFKAFSIQRFTNTGLYLYQEPNFSTNSKETNI